MANEKKSDSINLADVKAQVEAMLAQAKAEAEKIISDAKATAKGEMTEEEKLKKAERDAYWNELVPRTLFKDNGKYKDDVLVAVNDEHIKIKRGETVMIKRKFASVLDASDKQNYSADKYIEQKSKERPLIAEM